MSSIRPPALDVCSRTTNLELPSGTAAGFRLFEIDVRGRLSQKDQMYLHDSPVASRATTDAPASNLHALASREDKIGFCGDLQTKSAFLRTGGQKSPKAFAAFKNIAVGARKANKPVIAHCPDREIAQDMAKLGAAVFINSNGRSFITKAAFVALEKRSALEPS